MQLTPQRKCSDFMTFFQTLSLEFLYATYHFEVRMAMLATYCCLIAYMLYM